MDVEVGDRVQFKAKGLPKHPYHGPGMAEDESATWADYFSDAKGVVDSTDPLTDTVRVRGRDRNGDLYTIWIDPKHLDVTEPGVR